MGLSSGDEAAEKISGSSLVQKLFEGIENGLNTGAAAMKDNHFLSFNFSPVENEISLGKNLVVNGTLPACLNGEFVRTGPNPKYKPRGGYHWFDGDGMLHGVRIHDGDASYVNRFVRTSRYAQEEKLGRPIFVKLGEMHGWTGLGKLFFSGLRKMLGVTNYSMGIGTANTALVYHAQKLMALCEPDAPYAIRVQQDGQLETIGRQDYDGKLNQPFTAHPKIDAVTGEMFTFGYDIKQPYLQYRVVSAGGDIGPCIPITIRGPIMMHDFAITENYAVFMDLPLCFKKEKIVTEPMPFVWDGSQPSRFGILPRYDLSELNIRWFELPSCFIFHSANAWEEGDEVILHAVRYTEMQLDLFGNGFKDGEIAKQEAYFYQFRFDLKTGEASQKQLGDFMCEFPRINEKLVGRKQKYVYAGVASSDLQFTGVVKFDMTEEPSLGAAKARLGGNVVGLFQFGEGRFGGEPVFVPRTSDEGAEEDDGYLLSFVFDEAKGTSDLLVIDAKTMAQEPVAVVTLPVRVPYGFHGIFVSEEQLLAQSQESE